MTGEDRQRLKEIFAEAVEREGPARESFLDEACAGDPELLAEVLRLIAAHERSGSFISTPAAAPLLEDGQPPLFQPEQVVADRFRIVRFIARGGMGEVYEAEDRLLGERVALKTVWRRGSGEEELARLKGEIQSARRVAHANVCRTFDVAEHDDPPVTVFTMELLEGSTLSRHLQEKGPFTRSEALPVIRQISAGLQAAHDAGVIHRDFKSGNVILTSGPAGVRPVITDFGLALRVHSALRPPVVHGGTPGYMAPEQLEGGPITPAVDVYALGVVIARMIGARPSAGMRFTPSKPGPFPNVAGDRHRLGPWRRVVERCLERNPAERYQKPADVAAALGAVTGNARRNRAFRSLAWAALLILAGIGSWYVLSQRLHRAPDIVPGTGAMTKRQVLLKKSDRVWRPSPDGSLLALTDFEARRLILHEVATGNRREVQTPRGPNREAASVALNAVFSPRGDRLAYTWQSGDGTHSVRVTRTDSSDDRSLYSHPLVQPTPLDWSPDGRSIVAQLAWRDRTQQYVILSADKGAFLFEGPRSNELLGRAVFYRDARKVVYQVLQPGPRTNWDIRVLSLDDGLSTPLVEHPASDELVGWARDGSTLVFTSSRAGSIGIYALRFSESRPAGDPHLLTLDLGAAGSIGLSGDGSLFYTITRSDKEVYTAEIDVETSRVVSGPRRVEWDVQGAASFPSWSADGNDLAFLSRTWQDFPLKGTVFGIYSRSTGKTRRVESSEATINRLQWLGASGWLVGPGTGASGKGGQHRLDPATGRAALVIDIQTLGSGFEGVWSASGKNHFNRFADYRKGLFRLNIETGDRRIIYVPPEGENMGRENLALSPDERTLAFQLFSLGKRTSRLMLIPTAGGAAKTLWTVLQPDVFMLGAFAWSRDGRYILAAKTRNQTSEIWRVPVDGSQPTKIDAFPEMIMMMNLRVNPDGKTIAFGAGELEIDEVWVLQNLPFAGASNAR